MSHELAGPLVDAHCHFFTHRFFSAIAAEKWPEKPREAALSALSEQTRIEIPEEDPATLAERWMRELNQHELDQIVLIASIPGDQDSVLRAASLHPDRLLPYAMFRPQSEDAAASLEKAAKQGLRGFCLFPAMHQFSVDDDRILSLIEVAAKHGLVVFVHMGILKLGLRDKLGLRSPFDLRFSHPLSLSRAALRFPETAFVIPHLGSGFFQDALHLSWQYPNVYLDTSSSNSWIAMEPGRPSHSDVFAQALDVVGPTRLLFGTDSNVFPRGYRSDRLQEQLALFRDLGLSKAEEAQIFGGNLQRLLKR